MTRKTSDPVHCWLVWRKAHEAASDYLYRGIAETGNNSPATGPDRAKRWLAFLRNHREAIAAMDFFTVPTITFGVLYCFFIISHDT